MNGSQDDKRRFAGTICVMNPRAGRLRSERNRTEILSLLSKLDVEVVEMQRDGTLAQDIAKRKDKDIVVACGGDGTVGLVANNIAIQRQRLAVFPAGRGNSVARDLGCSTIAKALAALKRGATRKLDALEVAMRCDGEERKMLALHAVAFGALAEVVIGASRFPFLGALAYPVEALLSAPAARGYEVRIDGETLPRKQYKGVVVLNTAWLSGFRPSSKARSDDGLLDLLFQPSSWTAEKLSELALILGAPAFEKQSRQGESCTILPDRPGPVYIDGEVLEDASAVRVKVLPRTLDAIFLDERR